MAVEVLWLNVIKNKASSKETEDFYIIPRNGKLEVYYDGNKGLEKIEDNNCIQHTWNMYERGEVALVSLTKADIIKRGLSELLH